MNTNCNVPSSKQLRCANVLDLYRQPRTAFVYAILQVEVITSIRGDLRKIAHPMPARLKFPGVVYCPGRAGPAAGTGGPKLKGWLNMQAGPYLQKP